MKDSVFEITFIRLESNNDFKTLEVGMLTIK